MTLADPRVRARHKSDTGLGRIAETRARSVRVKNIPSGTQEAIVQQLFERIASVKRVELFSDKGEAVVELESAAVRTSPPLMAQTLTGMTGSRKAPLTDRADCPGGSHTGSLRRRKGRFTVRRAVGQDGRFVRSAESCIKTKSRIGVRASQCCRCWHSVNDISVANW